MFMLRTFPTICTALASLAVCATLPAYAELTAFLGAVASYGVFVGCTVRARQLGLDVDRLPLVIVQRHPAPAPSAPCELTGETTPVVVLLALPVFLAVLIVGCVVAIVVVPLLFSLLMPIGVVVTLLRM